MGLHNLHIITFLFYLHFTVSWPFEKRGCLWICNLWINLLLKCKVNGVKGESELRAANKWSVQSSWLLGVCVQTLESLGGAQNYAGKNNAI